MSGFDLHPSSEIADAIGRWEGGQSSDGLFHPYWDAAGGVWTIGFGHTGNVSQHSRPLTLKEAQALLQQDLDHHYAPAVRAAHRLEKQKQFDATLSFVYNGGVGLLQSSHTFGAYLANHEFQKAADSLLLYDHAANGQVLEGLRRRREWERQLFLGGSYAVRN